MRFVLGVPVFVAATLWLAYSLAALSSTWPLRAAAALCIVLIVALLFRRETV